MTCQLEIAKPLTKYLEKLPADIFERLKEGILYLEENPRPFGCEKMLIGSVLEIIEIYSLQVKILLLTVIDAGHRREIFKK